MAFVLNIKDLPEDVSRQEFVSSPEEIALNYEGIEVIGDVHAFGELATRGIKSAVLSVDTKNKSGAPALYQEVGMRSVRASHTYVKELRPGRNLVPQ